MTSKPAIALALLGLGLSASMNAVARDNGRGGDNAGVIYVISQGLYFDTFGAATLPPRGRFQQLYITPDGPMTMYGPGDVGYLGGRWWIDENGNNEMDEGDMFFLCPLLGPGREEP